MYRIELNFNLALHIQHACSIIFTVMLCSYKLHVFLFCFVEKLPKKQGLQIRIIFCPIPKRLEAFLQSSGPAKVNKKFNFFSKSVNSHLPFGNESGPAGPPKDSGFSHPHAGWPPSLVGICTGALVWILIGCFLIRTAG